MSRLHGNRSIEEGRHKMGGAIHWASECNCASQQAYAQPLTCVASECCVHRIVRQHLRKQNKQVQGSYGIVQAWEAAAARSRRMSASFAPHLAVNAVAAGGGDGPDLVRRVCTQGWCDTDYSVGTPTPTVAHSRRREDTGDVGRPARRLQRVLCAWLACCGRHLSRGPPEAFCDPTHASIRRARHPQQPARRHRRLLPPGRALGLWFL